MSVRSFRRGLALAILALSAGTAGVAAAMGRSDAVPTLCRQAPAPADRIGRPHGEPLPFLGASGLGVEIAARQTILSETRRAEDRHGHGQEGAGRAAASLRSPQGILAVERRRLRLAPGLERAAAGRLRLFATAPPFPSV